jgi:hypothetical protein
LSTLAHRTPPAPAYSTVVGSCDCGKVGRSSTSPLTVPRDASKSVHKITCDGLYRGVTMQTRLIVPEKGQPSTLSVPHYFQNMGAPISRIVIPAERAMA